MNTRVSFESERFSPAQRFTLGVGGMLLAVLLVTAACLTPDPAGLGTHEQLGLPGCTFRWLFSTRCPSCGMTTSWAHLMRGQIGPALRANVGGVLLAVGALVIAPWCVISAARGTWLVRPPSDGVLAGVAIGIAIVTLVDWSVRVTLR